MRARQRRIINFTLLKRNRRTPGVAKIGNESPPAKSDIAFNRNRISTLSISN